MSFQNRNDYEHEDTLVYAAATALAREATAEFIRVNGGGRPWDSLPTDRQEAAIRSQIKYARIVLDAASGALRDAVARLRDEQYEIVTTLGMGQQQVQAAATKSFAFQTVLDLIDGGLVT